MKKTILLALTMLWAGVMFAQTNVSGTVVGAEDGQPVVGAYILQQGTNNGTSTDLDGNFTISVPNDATLVVSSIG